MGNDTIPLKRCTKCHEEKPATLEYFSKCSKVKCGLKAECKQCQRAYNHDEQTLERRRILRRQEAEGINAERRIHYHQNKQRYSGYARTNQQRHAEQISERQRARYQQNKETVIVRVREYSKRNAERISEYQREYRELNAEKRTAYLREYARKNPHIGRNSWHRYRARKLALPNNWTPQDWQQCLDYWNHQCAVCGNLLSDKRHADHWIPLNYKGVDNPGTVPMNMICLCQSCNASKCDTPPERWLTKRFGEKKAGAILKRIEVYFEWVRNQHEQRN